jgi:hypothetical protein
MTERTQKRNDERIEREEEGAIRTVVATKDSSKEVRKQDIEKQQKQETRIRS